MKNKRVIVIVELRGMLEIEIELGPIIPACLAWRIWGIPKQTLYSWIESRRLTRVVLMGQTMIVQEELQALTKVKNEGEKSEGPPLLVGK